MGWLEKLFRLKNSVSSGTNSPLELKTSEIAERITIAAGKKVPGELGELISGYQLCVTMSRRTPLAMLLRHGEMAPEPSDVPQQHAIWIAIPKPLKVLGFKELPQGTMASEIGQIPQDGGNYLSFLIEYRTIIESGGERSTQLLLLDKLGAQYPDITQKTGGNLSQSFCLDELMEISGCGRSTAQYLYDAGYRSKDEVSKSSSCDLEKVKGIGKKTAKKLVSR